MVSEILRERSERTKNSLHRDRATLLLADTLLEYSEMVLELQHSISDELEGRRKNKRRQGSRLEGCPEECERKNQPGSSS